MKKNIALALGAILSLGILTGCGGSSGETKQMTIIMGEGGVWIYEPDHIVANKGDTIELTLINKDAAQPHSLLIPDLNFNSGEIAPNAEGTFTVNASKKGEFEFYCDVPGHREVGMVGKITVQ